MSNSPIAVLPVNGDDKPMVAVLLNMNARSVTPKVIRAIQKVVPARDLYASRSLEDAHRIVKDVYRKGYNTVLTGGGDGTFVGFLGAFREYVGQSYSHEGNAVRALEPIPFPRLGILRLGTGNALAGYSNASPLPGGGMLEDILNVRSGRVSTTRRMDLIEAEGVAAPFAGFGYDSLILNNYLRFKKITSKTPLSRFTEGLPGYAMSIAMLSVPEVAFGSFPDVEIRNAGAPAYRVDNEGNQTGEPIVEGGLIYEGPTRFVSTGTCPYFGFKMKMFPFADRKPGNMQLRVATTTIIQAFSNLPAIWQGTWRSPSFQDFFVQRIHIKFKRPMPLQIGGDAKGNRTEIELSVAKTPVQLIDFAAKS